MVFSRGAINRINPFPSPFFSASTFIDKNDHFELLSTCFSCCINGDWGLLYYTTNCGIVLPINFTTLLLTRVVWWCALLFSGLPFLYSSLFQSICITTTTSDWLRIWIQKLLQQLSPLFQLIYVFQNPTSSSTLLILVYICEVW